jgi:hypothetical protein
MQAFGWQSRFCLDLSDVSQKFLSTLVYRRRHTARQARKTALSASMTELSQSYRRNIAAK